MSDFIFQVISVFFLFTVALPVAGIVLGALVYFVLPYLLGAVIALSLSLLSGIQLGVYFWGLALFWAIAVFMLRARYKAFDDLNWATGHFRAAFSMLLFGLPYKRHKAQWQRAYNVE